MAPRPTLVAEADTALQGRRKQASDNLAGASSKVGQPAERTVTVHYDVAAIVRAAFYGLASVLLALTFLIVAWQGGTNYPTTSTINAVGAVIAASDNGADKQK